MQLAILAGAWFIGLMLGFLLDGPHIAALLLAAASLLLAIILGIIRFPVWPAILVGVLLLGLWRVEITATPANPLVTQPSQQVTLRGVIADDPEPTRRLTRFELKVEAVDRGDGWHGVVARSLVYAEPPPGMVSRREPPYFQQGDALTLRGTLETPEPIEGFDYPAYLASQGISGVFWSRHVEWHSEESTTGWHSPIFAMRRELARSLESALPVPHSALAQALLLGIRGDLPPDVVEDFRNTGASHLLAISGMHVGVLLVMAAGSSAWALGRRRQVYLLLPLAAIWLYALVSGLPVSVVRAALMGSIYLAALGLGRPQSALPPLALSAIIITAFDPLALRQVSFQLSFAAMAGIILALPFQARAYQAIRRAMNTSARWWELWLRTLTGWLASALIVSFGATLATLPLVAFNFGRIPLLGIPITILALPALPFILAGSFLTAVAGMVHPILGQIVGVTTWVPLSYLLGLVSRPPGVTLSGAWVGAPLVWGWYVTLGLLLLIPRGWKYLKRVSSLLSIQPGGNPRESLASVKPNGLTFVVGGVGLILLVANVVLWSQFLRQPDGMLHVYFLDVGQGDSVLIVTPSGRQVLIDGGPNAESATAALSEILPVWDRSLDLVALTHLDADHSRGLLGVLDRYRVGAAMVGVPDSAAPLFVQWQAATARNKVEELKLARSQSILIDDGVRLETLHPDEDSHSGASDNRNNNGLVFRLVYGETSFLLTADIEAESENKLVRDKLDLASDVLKIAHHGSKTSTTTAFLQAASPAAAVISAGADNQFGHPHPDVVSRLEEAVGADRIYQTARHGTVQFISDGQRVWVQTER